MIDDPKPKIIAWGDSLTKGQGEVKSTYPGILQQLSSARIVNEGVNGQTSTEISARMADAKDLYKYPVIIWAGRNNYKRPEQVKADISDMVSKLGHTHYLILGILNGDKLSERKGETGYNTITKLNADLAIIYGEHFIDIRPYLVSQYNPQSDADLKNFNDDVPPVSLRNDDLHLNSGGNKWVAEKINGKIGLLIN